MPPPTSQTDAQVVAAFERVGVVRPKHTLHYGVVTLPQHLLCLLVPPQQAQLIGIIHAGAERIEMLRPLCPPPGRQDALEQLCRICMLAQVAQLTRQAVASVEHIEVLSPQPAHCMALNVRLSSRLRMPAQLAQLIGVVDVTAVRVWVLWAHLEQSKAQNITAQSSDNRVLRQVAELVRDSASTVQHARVL